MIQDKDLCPSTTHTASVVTSDLSVIIGKITEDMLRPYTTYLTNVAAVNDTLESTEYGFPISFTTEQSSECLIS